ncbi:interleukin-17C isoform X1 [Megalobrama amblycephala]|uniref:interleukin-17C isoform X1 n=1 Tax=Megalobrama amblycephala TaxID=75352 RepID=UPI002014466F|nr:interleukin-17C isoform X1 [Megalobrama amblycephala]
MLFPLFFGIFFFLLSEHIVEGKHVGCFKDSEHAFGKTHKKLLQAFLTPARHPHPRPARHSADSCDDFVRSSSDLSKRSLSPWRTRTVQKPDMYPSSYEEAECLCDGCIINGVENMTYNSVPVSRSHLFLKKVPCPSDSSKYALEYEFVSVTVACTCAVPDQTTI